MANFCKSCCFDLFGVDISDFDGIISEEDYDNGMVANVLCEGCGFIEVDHKGEKVDRLDNRVRRFQGHPHDNNNEAVTRRTLEQAIQDLNNKIITVQKMQSPVTSKASKKHQFLLMGMKHG